MDKYSPLSRIIIKDFRNIQDIQLDFSESPIIALVGGNDVGKTSVLKAFEVCALHHNSRGQKGYIRTGAPFFGVGIQLADGTSIVRIKTKDNINKYEVRKPDGSVWTTNKISEGLPVEVSNVMGMVEEPETREYLQVRTYEDQLLLVYTPASTNYKVMYDALKVGQITRAVRRGTDEANRLKQKIIDNGSSIRALENNINKISVIDMTGLLEVREAVRIARNKLSKIESAISIADKIEEVNQQIGVARLIETYQLDSINELKANLFNSAIGIVNSMSEVDKELSEVSKVSNLITINEIQAEHMNKALEDHDRLQHMVEEMERYKGIGEASEISESIIKELQSSVATAEKVESYSHELQEYNDVAKLEPLESEVKTLEKLSLVIDRLTGISNAEEEIKENLGNVERFTQLMKESGARVEQCPNCGTDIVLEA